MLAAVPQVLAAPGEPLTSEAARFVVDGAKQALRACDLPRRTCHGRKLQLQAAQGGSSNDEERSVETLVQPGLRAEVVFPRDHRNAFLLGSVEVTSSKWSSLFGVAPGVDRVMVRARLGAPTASTEGPCDVYVSEETQSSAVVCYRGSVVARIRWEYFID